ncbi:serine/threonine-protein kinase [Arthrobacter sp. MYb214]|uniref:serine/threonine-protein kinase n=1 Tax=Arthrobacter sp. MYb214 TaxID=1848596 RepID=UPI0015E44946|nr:serine/threonine-protein kinase [Arthrobacter sp. MYb214]
MNLSEIPLGTTINDRYELTKKLGDGAGGSVYKAHDRHLDAIVAVKILDPTHDTLGMPWQEARLLQQLRSRYLLEVLNADIVINSDLRFIVTSLMNGGDLENHCRPHGLLPSEVAQRVQQIASGLDRIHRAGMLHRDVKPGNAMLNNDQTVLGDLGFCHLLDSDGITPPNGSFCTVAPEALGANGKCSKATDVYSLAATTFYLLSGEYPVDHQISRQEQNDKIMAGSLRELRSIAPHISRAVGSVVRKSLSRDPAKRHSSVTEFGNALAQAVQGSRDWERVTHADHLHCLIGANHGAKKAVRVCAIASNDGKIRVSAKMHASGRQISGYPDRHITESRLAIELQRLTSSL